MTQDIPPFVRSWLDDTSTEAPDATAITQTVVAAVRTIPQDRRWFSRPASRFVSLSLATGSIVAAVALLSVGGLLAVLLLGPDDGRTPIVGASPSPSDPGPALSPAPETSVRTDLVTGVPIVTEEVEPGVFRVVSDGERDLTREFDADDYGYVNGNIVAGLDRSVWWFGPEGFFRLGDEHTHRFPNDQTVHTERPIKVAPDGTVWFLGHDGLHSFDGEAWTIRMEKRLWDLDIELDGTMWAVWNEADEAKVGRWANDAWEVLGGSAFAAEGPGDDEEERSEDVSPPFAQLLAMGDDDIWVLPEYLDDRRLSRYVDESWQIHETPDDRGLRVADVGPDGTLWVAYSSGSGRAKVIARFDEGGWRESEIPSLRLTVLGGGLDFFEAADGSVWFNPRLPRRVCDGVANYDGDTLRMFLPGLCVAAMDVGLDGRLWVQAGAFGADGPAAPIHTYVITPDAAGIAA